jgi:WD40 repeat protein
MKRVICVFGLVIFIIVACSSNQNMTPTLVAIPTSTNTRIPPTFTTSPTITPSPTPELPVGLKTPIPEFSTEISLNNVKDLTEVARYYGNLPHIAKLTKDETLLFIRNQASIDIYDFQTKKLKIRINHYAVTTDDFGLQISDDGKWALIDGAWLLNAQTGTTEKDLINVYTLVGFKDHFNPIPLTALSADGTKLAIGEFYQSGQFYILDTETSEIIYKSVYGIYGSSPVFSPDGSMIVTNIDNQIILWSISDGKPIKKFPLEFFGAGVAFSEDSTLIAIRQSSGNIDIWNLKTDKKTGSIQSNSSSCYNVRSIFSSIPAFSQDNENIATFDCNGNVQVWSIYGSLLSEKHYDIDIPSLIFDKNDNMGLIVLPYSVSPWGGYQGYQMNAFQFRDNETISLQYYDSYYQTRRGCTISLRLSNQNCGDNLTLGTDNKYYKYVIEGSTLKLFSNSASTSSKPLYEIQWSGLEIGINRFDPQHALLLFTTYPTQYTGDGRLVDLETGELINKWELRAPNTSAFSEDNNVAAICLDLTGYGVSYFNNVGKLSFIDLVEGKIVYEETFTCSGLALSHSAENRQIAISYETLPPGSQYLKSLLLIMNFNTYDERKKIDVGCDRSISSLAYSPDDSILVVSCSYGSSDGSIHFLNASDGTEIQNIEGYPGINSLAFSPDGKLLALSFGGGLISILAVPSNAP